MKRILRAATCGACVAAAVAPASAAELVGPDQGSRMGTFARARLRVPLGGDKEKARAGLALTSTIRSASTGELRMSRGLELGVSSDRKLGVALQGKPVSRLAPGREGPQGPRMGMSTVGWVAIGVGVTLVAAFLAYGAIGDAATD